MPAPPRLVPWLLPLPSRSHSRKPGASRTTASSEGETSSSPIVDHAQILLDRPVQTLVEMETVARAGPPRTVVAWHRAGFRLYWRWLSRSRRVGDRTGVSQEIRTLISRMAAENPTWGAPRIHGELLKLGFLLSEPTVSRWLQRIPRTPDP